MGGKGAHVPHRTRGGSTTVSEANPPHVSAAAIRASPSMPDVRQRRRFGKPQISPAVRPAVRAAPRAPM
jgi:hypothetical protein